MTGRSDGRVTCQNRRSVDAPSMAAASCNSSGTDCRPASSTIVVCGMPAQTPTTMTAGSAVLKSPSQLVVPSNPNVRMTLFTGPEFGLSISRHMMAMITGGIAHGTSASVRVSDWKRRLALSSRARQSAARNCRIVTENIQIRPIRNDSQNRW